MIRFGFFHALQRVANAVSRKGGPIHVIYNAFCSDIVECVYAESRADLERLAGAISLTKGLPLKGATVAAKLRKERRRLVRRVIPDPSEMDLRFGKPTNTYRNRVVGRGAPIMHSDAMARLRTQIGDRVRRGCDSDPPGGLYRQEGELVIACNDP